MMSTSGLMVVSNVGPFAKEFGVADMLVVGMAALPLSLTLSRVTPALFVVLTGLVFFGWGEIFSLFPSTLTDTYGPRYAATNYGFLYMAQGVGSILGGPAAAFLKQATGSWTAVFIVVAVLDAITALLAITVLRRMRQKHLAAG
jgi:MFS transporter, OFA family, oxalate/formate antiporter